MDVRGICPPGRSGVEMPEAWAWPYPAGASVTRPNWGAWENQANTAAGRGCKKRRVRERRSDAPDGRKGGHQVEGAVQGVG